MQYANKHASRVLIYPRSLHRSVVLGALSLVGCAVDTSGAGMGSEVDPLAQEIKPVTDPNGTYYAEVTANGAGCRAGSWNTRISSDGQVFTTTFSAYELGVGPGPGTRGIECDLTIRLRTPEGRSFSVQSFSYSGYALLQQGVTGRQTASYSFEGLPTMPIDSNRRDLVGPYDDAFLFNDDVRVENRRWTPCGNVRDLNIRTRMQLNSTSGAGTGFMNMSAIDGSRKLEIKLQTRKCSLIQPGTTLEQVSQVRVAPNEVQRGQPFTMTWQPVASTPDVMYTAQVRDAGLNLLWESPAVAGRSVSYNGPALPPGNYHVTVQASDGSSASTSEPVSFFVVGGGAVNPNPDPTPPAPSGLPSWAGPLLGRYAARTHAFAVHQNGTMMFGHQLALVDFVQVGNGVEMRSRVCDQVAGSRAGTVTLKTPEAYPEVRREVSYANGRFSTSPNPLPTGFLREGVSECRGREGQYVAKRPEQRWIAGSSCRCPRNQYDVPRADDCRMTDPDGDGNPGLAYGRGNPFLGGSFEVSSHMVTVTRSHLLNGLIDPNGNHQAQYRSDEMAYEIQCASGPCPEPRPADPCTPNYNATKFVRLGAAPSGGEWTCALVRASESRFFSEPRAPTPSRCQTDKLTQLP